mmetsp:Transcript_74216/g.192825  ORF Transcript_74216/g.192825 Transcript_74216/m.192825 type:complete len:205 (+) Transcript_74216:400-1014(+)
MAPPMSMVQRERVRLPALPFQFFFWQFALWAAWLIARPRLARFSATMLTSTPHWTPLPTAPSPITRRRLGARPPRVWSPSSLIFVVGKAGGLAEQVGAAKDAAADNSPRAAMTPVTPAAQTASMLAVAAQLEAASESLAAIVPTKAIMTPLSTWQPSSEAVSRGEGQVRTIPLISLPKPIVADIASMTLKMHVAVPCSWPFSGG